LFLIPKRYHYPAPLLYVEVGRFSIEDGKKMLVIEEKIDRKEIVGPAEF
jgi:hypothetical protein